VSQLNYAHAEGIDTEDVRNWVWPG
jgi:hypothetical protein